MQKLYIDACISCGETGEIERIECWLFFLAQLKMGIHTPSPENISISGGWILLCKAVLIIVKIVPINYAAHSSLHVALA